MNRSPLHGPLGSVGLVTGSSVPLAIPGRLEGSGPGPHEPGRAALELLTKAVTVPRDTPLR